MRVPHFVALPISLGIARRSVYALVSTAVAIGCALLARWSDNQLDRIRITAEPLALFRFRAIFHEACPVLKFVVVEHDRDLGQAAHESVAAL